MSDAVETIAPPFSIAMLAGWVGRELGCSDWVCVDQPRIDQFAACTGDDQWIHVDVERARRESPLGGPVAHGYLTLALLAPLSMQVGIVPADAKAAVNYGLDKVRFMAPVRSGASVRLRLRVLGVTPQDGGRHLVKLLNTLEVEGQPRPALVAETLVMLFEG
jgi:acyl dehydratase